MTAAEATKVLESQAHKTRRLRLRPPKHASFGTQLFTTQVKAPKGPSLLDFEADEAALDGTPNLWLAKVRDLPKRRLNRLRRKRKHPLLGKVPVGGYLVTVDGTDVKEYSVEDIEKMFQLLEKEEKVLVFELDQRIAMTMPAIAAAAAGAGPECGGAITPGGGLGPVRQERVDDCPVEIYPEELVFKTPTMSASDMEKRLVRGELPLEHFKELSRQHPAVFARCGVLMGT